MNLSVLIVFFLVTALFPLPATTSNLTTETKPYQNTWEYETCDGSSQDLIFTGTIARQQDGSYAINANGGSYHLSVTATWSPEKDLFHHKILLTEKKFLHSVSLGGRARFVQKTHAYAQTLWQACP